MFWTSTGTVYEELAHGSHCRGIALLIAALVTAQKSGGSPPTTMVAKDYRFDVDAEQVWIDTGLDFQKGDRVFVCGGVLDLWRPVTYRDAAFAASVGPGRSAACEAATGSEAGSREPRRGIACHRF
jgi:hypothetical protein